MPQNPFPMSQLEIEGKLPIDNLITRETPVFDLRSWGGDPLGTFDSTPALIGVMAKIYERGRGLCYAPGGTYKWTDEVMVYGNTGFIGDGFQTILQAPSGKKAYFKIYNAANTIFKDFKMSYIAPITVDQDCAGALRFQSGSRKSLVDHVYFYNPPKAGLNYSACTDMEARNIYGEISGQAVITATNTQGLTILGGILKPGKNANVFAEHPSGIDVGDLCTDVTINGPVIKGCHYGLYFRDDAKRVNVQNIVIEDGTLDGIAVVTETGTYSLIDSSFVNISINGFARHGFDIWKSVQCLLSDVRVNGVAEIGIRALSYNENLDIEGCKLSLCGQHGIGHMSSSNKQLALKGNTCYRNGNGGAYAGIYLAGDSRIVGNICHDKASPLQKYGIWSTEQTPAIHGNVCFGNITSQIYISAGAYRGINIEGYSIKSSRATEAASTGAGTVKMASGNPADNAGWFEIEDGKWVPYWADPTP